MHISIYVLQELYMAGDLEKIVLKIVLNSNNVYSCIIKLL